MAPGVDAKKWSVRVCVCTLVYVDGGMLCVMEMCMLVW